MKKILTAAFLLLIASAARAALPDQITDPATRDVVEALDAKVDFALATIAASSATPGTPANVQPVALGGTGATTANGALANLGAPSVTGAGATGTWPINITGSAADAATATSVVSGGVDFSTITTALGGKLSNTTTVTPGLIDLSTVTTALSGKLSNTSTVPNGLIDLSTVTTALATMIPSSATGTYPLTSAVSNSLTFSAVTFSIPTNYPQTFTGTLGWDRPDHVSVYDGILSTGTTTPGHPATLYAMGFGFNIPTSAIITSIKVTYLGSTDGNPGAAKTYSSIGGCAFAASVSALYDNSIHTDTYPLSAGACTPAQINDSGFGASFYVYKISGSGVSEYLDFIRITINYAVNNYSVGLTTSSSFAIANSTSVGMGQDVFTMHGSSVGINNINPQYALDVNGTENINGALSVNGISNVGTSTATYFYGNGANLTGIVATPPNTITSSLTVTGAAMGYGLSVSSNIYVVGFSSAAKYYGDGSSLTGVATSGGSISTVTIDALPIGTFIQYGSTTAPSSYLYCDGTSYSTTTYSALYAVIGYKYGGSGANFTCDFRGMFARGLDTTGTIDSEARVIGSSETDRIQDHLHNIYYGATVGIGDSLAVSPSRSGPSTISGTGVNVSSARISTETRPKNIAVAIMVKYQNPVVNYNGLTSSNTWSGSNTFTGPVVGIARSSTTASIPGTTGTNTTFGACVNGSTLTITTQGNPIMVNFTATVTNSVSNNGTLANIRIDGSLPSGYGTNNAITYCDSVAGVGGNCAFTFVTDSLSAGSHSVCLVLRTQFAATWTLLSDGSNGYPRMTIMNIAQ